MTPGDATGPRCRQRVSGAMGREFLRDGILTQ
jgi:hypothetical protein